MRRVIPGCGALLAALALSGCGQSDADKAQAKVCDARADISKQVDALKALTPSTFSTDAVSKSLSAIRSDLSSIKGAQGDLSEERRQQVQDANQAFEDQLKGIAQQVVTSKSTTGAGTQVTSALQQLAQTYQQTFARVNCS
jgi:methyl-accepting chemotaxis protein